MKTIMLITAILGGSYYWYSQKVQIHALKKKRSKKPQAQVKTQPIEKKDFSCVIIQPDAVPCSAVRALDGEPILMREASALPLAACYKTTCNCGFNRYSDRRRIENRRNNSNLAQQANMSGAYRRTKKDRRMHANS